MKLIMEVYRTFDVNVDNIKKYLIKQGWIESSCKFEFVEWLLSPENPDIVCIIPLSEDVYLADKSNVVETAIRFIADFYSQNVEYVISAIKNVDSDF